MSAPQPACPWCAKTGEECGVTHFSPRPQLFCTRPKNHNGEHVACVLGDLHDLARWPNESEARPAVKPLFPDVFHYPSVEELSAAPTAPTEAALRAAKAMVESISVPQSDASGLSEIVTDAFRHTTAIIIDRETGLPELLADNAAMRTALHNLAEAVLLFYSVDWTEEKKLRWLSITGSGEATTKILGDVARAALARAQGRDTTV